MKVQSIDPMSVTEDREVEKHFDVKVNPLSVSPIDTKMGYDAQYEEAKQGLLRLAQFIKKKKPSFKALKTKRAYLRYTQLDVFLNEMKQKGSHYDQKI